MIEYTNSRAARIIGPHAEVLTRDSMPASGTTRWVASRKAQVVAAVEGGLMTIDEVMARYNLSPEEFYGWQRALHTAGVPGLRVAWAQHDRAARRRPREVGGHAARQLEVV
jgi:capsule polysaccharide export protein KpsC/LpsZ